MVNPDQIVIQCQEPKVATDKVASVPREDPFRSLLGEKPEFTGPACDSKDQIKFLVLQDELNTLGDKINSPWDPDTQKFLKGLIHSFPEPFKGENVLSSYVYGLARSLSTLINRMVDEGERSLQFEIPPLTRALADSVHGALYSHLPTGRYLLRRQTERALTIVNGDPSTLVSPERVESARALYNDLLRGKLPKSIDSILYEVRQVWSDVLESKYDHRGDWSDVAITLHTKESEDLESVLKISETLQKQWLAKGKYGVGTLFTVEDILHRFAPDEVRANVLTFYYKEKVVEQCILYPNPEGLAAGARSFIQSSEGFNAVHFENNPHSWLFLTVSSPRGDDAAQNAGEEFRSEFFCPPHPFMMRICADVSIAQGAVDMLAVVNADNPVWPRHNNVGFVDTLARIESQFGRLKVMALPLEIPPALREEIKLLGLK